MKNNALTEYLTRDYVMKALSDDEVASVSTAETAERLGQGDEYLDLERLDLGVREWAGAATPMGRVLPRKAVHQKTWSKLLSRIAQFPSKKNSDATP